jgi:hypothetical protein
VHCSSRLLKPDADIILAQTCSLLAARPQVATVLCRFRISEALRVGNMCPDRNLVTDWTWTAYTLAQRQWATERDSLHQCLQQGAQCSQLAAEDSCRLAVSYADHWAGMARKELYGAVGTLYRSMLYTGLICDVCTGITCCCVVCMSALMTCYQKAAHLSTCSMSRHTADALKECPMEPGNTMKHSGSGAECLDVPGRAVS